jgi:tetratricopeptide (TPR) repeat protein
MNMKQRLTLLLALLFALGLTVSAQKLTHDQKKQIEILTPQADYLFSEQNYYRALPLYLKLINLDSTQDYYYNQAGICYLYTDEKEKSVKFLQRVYGDDPKAPDILYLLGRAFHVNYQFDTAINYFKKFLATNPDEEKKQNAKNYIDYCNNAKDLIAHPVKVKIINLGPTVNTAASEYAPVITADESEIIYTYRGPQSTGGLEDIRFKADTNGEYYEDIFITQKVGLNWITPEKVDDLDSKGNDAGIALSNDGQTLFSFRSTPEDGGDIYMSKLSGTSWSKPERMGSNINTKYWEGSCSLTSDGKTLYFASERPGGFGGRDIYYSRLQKDGTWGPAHNLGANINTPLNDDAPFIHPDGVTLFFSSEGWNSMGGYDIFYSTLNLEDSTWNRPVNLGYPINSPDDDRYYVLSADGTRGYFSSNRKGGYGQEDIYMVTPGYRGSRPVLALTIGVVSVDEKPTQADIKVTDVKTNEDRGTFTSNANTGKYIIALTPGSKYKIAVEVQGAKPHIEYLDIDSLATFVKVQEDVHLYTDAYKQSHNISVSDTNNVLQQKVDQQVTAYKAEQNLDTYRAEVYQRILNNYGSDDSDGVTYNVELGTYQNPYDFDSTKYKGLGKILHRMDANGNTIFYIDSMHTLLDAEILKYKVLSRDTTMKNHIEVTINNKNKREMMEQFYIDEYKKDKEDFVPDTLTDVIKANAAPMISLSDEDNKHGKVVLDTSRLEKDNGKVSIDGLSYRLELGSVTDTSQFKLGYLKKYGKIEMERFADGTIHYYMGPYKTLSEAQQFKQSLVDKEPDASKSIIMVFYFGKPKPAPEFFNPPCNQNKPQDFSAFVGKDLNDTAIYHKLIAMAGDICLDDLTFRVQIGAYRFPKNYKYRNLKDLLPPPAVVTAGADGITRFTLREFKSLKLAEVFRQRCIQKGTKDAWITAVYKGKRMLLQELIANNFYGQAVN